MNLEELEKLVGPIQRGKLAGRFAPDNPSAISAHQLPQLLNESASTVPPRPELEDLSHLNPANYKKLRTGPRGQWNHRTEDKPARGAYQK